MGLNPIELLQHELSIKLPSTWTRLRRPRDRSGTWWLDARIDDHFVTVEWQQKRGFGITASALPEGYGEGPDEVLVDVKEATARVLHLLSNREHSSPPRETMLRELRAIAGLSQEQVAARLGVQQAAVSKLERRSDITLGSLRRYISALGAEMEISIRTPSGEKVNLSDQKSRHACCSHVEARLAQQSSVPLAGAVDLCSDDLRAEDLIHESRAKAFELLAGLDCSSAQPLATVTLTTREIAISAQKAQLLCHLVAQRLEGALELSREELFSVVLRHLVAHEVGHTMARLEERSSGCAELHADALAGVIAGQFGDEPRVGSAIFELLGCQIPSCSHPTPEERSWAYFSGRSLGRGNDSSSASVTLLVIRASSVERSHAFYSILGLQFASERHGNGPHHYSCTVGDLVLELYPACDRKPAAAMRLGFRLSARPDMLLELRNEGLLRTPPTIARRGSDFVYVVEDPDGNALELQVQ